jgi:hypothetical protein
MLTFLVTVEATPGNKVVFDPHDRRILGYYQTLGVTARDEEELRRLIEDRLRSDLGSELLRVEERWEPDFAGGDHDICDVVGDWNAVGIWYASGRAFYGSDSN